LMEELQELPQLPKNIISRCLFGDKHRVLYVGRPVRDRFRGTHEQFAKRAGRDHIENGTR